MRCSIALENLSRTIPPIDEDENVAVHHAPFKGTTFSAGELAKLQKANTEHAGALTMFPAPAAPPSHYVLRPYTGEGKSFRKGGYPQRKSGRSRNQDKPTPSATITKPPKTSDSQTTMTVIVPQDSISRKSRAMMRPLALRKLIEETKETRNSQNEGMLPPAIIASRRATKPVYGGVEVYSKRSSCVMYHNQGVHTSFYESTPSNQDPM